jgi:PKD repeat protein
VRPRISVQGTEELCLGDVGFFTNNLGISVNWQIIDPMGNIINPGSFDDSLTYTFGSTPGTYQVIGSRTNYCQGGNLLVNVIAPPPPLSNFTGDTLVCTGVPYTYSATPDTAGVILEWESVGGNPSNVVGPNASIVWNSLPASLYVWQVSAKEPHCKSDTLIIPIRSAIPDSMPIIGPDTVCANSYSNYHTTFFNADEYRWEISPKRFGSVSTGFLNDSVEILWNNTSVPVDVEIILEARKCGTTLYDTFQVHIVPVILPYITAPDTVCQNDIVQLFESDSTIIEGSAWLWDLPGNDVSTQPNPTYQFDSAGVFNLILAVTDPFGCGGTFSTNHQIVVNQLPVGVLSSPTGNTLCLPGSSVLNVAVQQAGAYRYDWYQSGLPPTLIAFDGGTSQTVTDTGFYYVSIYDSATGCSNETNYFLLNCDTVGGDSCNLNPTLTLTDSLIYPTCGTFVLEGHSNLTVVSDVLIVFENGVANQFNQNPLQYSFDASGFYAVDYRATVTDGVDTCTVTESFVIEVPIFARFDHGISCGPAGQYTIDLRDLSDFVASNQINSWSWELNGSPVSSNQNPSINVTGGSTAIFTQRVSDGVNTCEVSDTITIPIPPQADFYWSIDTPCENTTVFFRDTSTGNIASWYWDFGDTSSNLNQHPEKVYRDPELIPGFFLPQLIVTDLYGCQDTAVDSLIWAPNNFSSNQISVSSNGLCSNLPVGLFVNPLNYSPPFPGGTNIGYLWSTGSQQSVTYASMPGSYTLTLTDGFGCNQVLGPQSVNFYQPPSAIIDGPNSICSNQPVSFFGFAGSSLIYQWFLNGNPYGGNDPVLSFPANGLLPGSNDVQLIVGQTYPPTDTCWDTSAVHTFQVFSPPFSPTLSSNTLNCDPFEVRLTSNVPVVWIPGAQVPSLNAFVSNPGTYEAIHTDTNGCSSQWNITVEGPPQVQSLLSGCYSICDTSLPLLIGNLTGNVDSFALFMNDSLILSGSGVPGNLYIYSAGRFTYWASNQGCSVWSDTLEVDVSPCSPCTGNISLGSITCDSGGTYTVKFDVDSFALGPNYYFDFESPGRTFTNVSPSNPVNITGVPFTIIATLDPGSNTSPGTSFIVDFDVYRPDFDTCNLQVEVTIPECPDSICEVEGAYFYPDSIQCYISDSTGLPEYELTFNPGNSISGFLILYSDQGIVSNTPYVPGTGANVSLVFSDTGSIDSIICFSGYVVNSDNQDSCLIDTCVEVTPCLDELDPCSNLEVRSTGLICLDSVGDGSSVVSYVLDIDYSGSSQSYYEISNSSGGDLIHISDTTLDFGSNLIYGQFVNRSDTSHLCISLVIYDPVAEDTCLFDTCLVLECEPIDTCEIENPEVQILCADTSGGIQEYFVTVRFNWPGQTPPFFASAVQSGTWTLLGNQSLQILSGLNEWNGRYVHTSGSNFFFEILTYDPSTGYPCEIYFEQELPTEDSCSNIPACGIKVDNLDIICVQPDSANGDLYRFVLDIGTTSGNFGPAPYYLVPNNGTITGVSSSAIWFTGGAGGAAHVDLISGQFRDVNNTGDLSLRLIIFDTANGTSCMFEITEGLPDCNDSLTTCEDDTATFTNISCEGSSNGIGASIFRLTINGLDGTYAPLVYALNGNSLNVLNTTGSSSSRIRFLGAYFDLPAYDDPLCMVVAELDVDGNPSCFDTFCYANPCSQSAKMAFDGASETDSKGGTTNEFLHMDLYPNPNKGQFTIALNDGLLDRTASIQVFDLTGKLVSGKFIGESTSGLFHLDIAGYSPGMYLVVCVSEEGQFLKTSRAIIQQ